MRKKAIPRIDVSMEELEKILERAREAPLDPEGYTKLKASVETLGYLIQLVEDKETTIQRLRQILCGASTEKSRKVLGDKQGTETSAGGSAASEEQVSPASTSTSTGSADDPAARGVGAGHGAAAVERHGV